jgi:hypothetical protein
METKAKTASSQILTCPHCGKTTNHDLAYRENYTGSIDDTEEGPPVGDDGWLAILKCKTCNRSSIYRNEWDNEQQKWVEILIYPNPVRAQREVPEKIRKKFDEAISVLKKSPSLTAVGIRKCLEGICDDKQAQGTTLAERISYLGANGFIPLPLSDMVDTSQTIRNIGSHFGNMDISLDEVNVLIEYTLALFECLYVVQERIDSVRKSVNNLE